MGHKTISTLIGVTRSNMLHEKMHRVWDHGWNCVVGGDRDCHMIMSHDDYKAEFEAATAELRSVLGL